MSKLEEVSTTVTHRNRDTSVLMKFAKCTVSLA